jgi:hypothetical protein
MRGNLWTMLVAAVGAGLFLMVGVPAAMPSTPSTSTLGASSVLSATSPFIGLILFLAALGALVKLGFRV